MLDTMSSSDDLASQGSPLPSPAAAVGELLQVVPRLVDRTRRQADLARSLLGALPCLGGSTGARATDGPTETPAEPEHEQVDVLSVLADEDLAEEPLVEEPPAEEPLIGEPVDDEAAAEVPATPTESELPIQDYDSLAASQVVPRLATLAPEELKIVQRYEQATRHRQTILHRVAQLLSD